MRTAVTTTARAASTRALNGSRGGRVGIERKIAGIRDGLGEPRCRGDHGRVVGAKRQRCRRGVRQSGAQLRVRRDSADDGDGGRTSLVGGLSSPLHERAHERALIAGGQIGEAAFQIRRRQYPDRVEQRCLETGEGEIEPWDPRNRKLVGTRVAFAREAADLRAAGIAESEQPCSLVERLPCRVVERRAQDSGFAAPILYVEEQRVAAARQQSEERWLE